MQTRHANPAPTVVGYTNIGIKKDRQQFAGAMFVKVGGENIDLQEIAISEGSANPDDCVMQIRWWDRDGQAYVNAYWGWEMDETGEFIFDEDGNFIAAWVDDNNMKITDKTFAKGEGFWFVTGTTTEQNPTITIAGQVVDTDGVATEFGIGLKKDRQQLVTCPFPVTYDLQKIRLSEGSANPDDCVMQIRWWNRDGQAYVNAYWGWEMDETGEFIFDEDGNFIAAWVDDNNMKIEGKTFAVGEGFWFVTGTTTEQNPQVIFDNPFAKTVE